MFAKVFQRFYGCIQTRDSEKGSQIGCVRCNYDESVIGFDRSFISETVNMKLKSLFTRTTTTLLPLVCQTNLRGKMNTNHLFALKGNSHLPKKINLELLRFYFSYILELLRRLVASTRSYRTIDFLSNRISAVHHHQHIFHDYFGSCMGSNDRISTTINCRRRRMCECSLLLETIPANYLVKKYAAKIQSHTFVSSTVKNLKSELGALGSCIKMATPTKS